jgi:hypothetical protein
VLTPLLEDSLVRKCAKNKLLTVSYNYSAIIAVGSWQMQLKNGNELSQSEKSTRASEALDANFSVSTSRRELPLRQCKVTESSR